MNHSVSDFISRIKNAAMARRKEVDLPYSKLNKEIGRVLQREGYLKEIKEISDKNKKTLHAVISYEKRIPVLSDISVISKPSLRVYKPYKNIWDIERRGKHKVVLTTSQGVMTGIEARKKGLGGEILFEIW
jgi:small subunit ribosomal protein S8